MKSEINHLLYDEKIKNFNDSNPMSECGCYKVSLFNFNEALNGYEGLVSTNSYKMRFLFRPAEKINIARTLIILHGHGSNKSYSKFYDVNWNVILPLDEFGTDGLGSWWLGENGDFKTYNLLQNLIAIMRKYFQFSSLYFWGVFYGRVWCNYTWFCS